MSSPFSSPALSSVEGRDRPTLDLALAAFSATQSSRIGSSSGTSSSTPSRMATIDNDDAEWRTPTTTLTQRFNEPGMEHSSSQLSWRGSYRVDNDDAELLTLTQRCNEPDLEHSSSQLSRRGSYRDQSSPARELVAKQASFNRLSQSFSTSNGLRESTPSRAYYQDSVYSSSPVQYGIGWHAYHRNQDQDTSPNCSQNSLAVYNPTYPTLINTLTLEAMVRVFNFYVDSNDFECESVLFLGSVCRRWRHIAWAQPSLWTQPIIYAFCKDAELQREMISHWLQRSGRRTYQLRLYRQPQARIDCRQILANEQPSLGWDPAPIFELLKTHSNRCISMDVKGPNNFLTHLREADISFPALKSLMIEHPKPTGQHSCKEYAFTPRLTDGLKTVRIFGLETYHLCLPMAPAVTGFSNLTEFIARKLDIGLALNILKRIKSLKELRISYFLTTETPLDEILVRFPERITCLALTSLDIFGHDEEDNGTYSMFFDRVNPPALMTLSVKHWMTDECIEMLLRSECTLRTLYLRKFVASTEKFVSCLSVLPSLVSLHISIVERDERDHRTPETENNPEFEEFDQRQRQEWRVILAALACGTILRRESRMAETNREKPLYLPLLQHLELYGEQHWDFPWPLLCRFLDSRGPPPANPLEYFKPDEVIPSPEHRTLRSFRWTVTGVGLLKSAGSIVGIPISDVVLRNLEGLAAGGVSIDMSFRGRLCRMRGSEVKRYGELTDVITIRLIEGFQDQRDTDLFREDDVDW